MNFVAVDVETANPDMSSICQIGIVKYAHGKIIDEWCSLIDPEDWFSDENIFIHGIGSEDVRGQPVLKSVEAKLRSMLEGAVVIHHTHFDRVALNKAFEKYSLPLLQSEWLDSAKVARRTWPDVAQRGYGLSSLCERIGYSFRHHDALEDAKAAAQVFLKASEQAGISPLEWLQRVQRPINVGNNISHRSHGNPDGVLWGEVVVFTGALQISRAEAVNLAEKMGCLVATGVNKNTTLLVVGDQDISKLAGHEKSTKHRKAEELILNGQLIKIVGETDFLSLF